VYKKLFVPRAVADGGDGGSGGDDDDDAMVSAALGTGNPWYVQAKFFEAIIAFTIGDVRRAVELYEEFLNIRIRKGGKMGMILCHVSMPSPCATRI